MELPKLIKKLCAALPAGDTRNAVYSAYDDSLFPVTRGRAYRKLNNAFAAASQEDKKIIVEVTEAEKKAARVWFQWAR